VESPIEDNEDKTNKITLTGIEMMGINGATRPKGLSGTDSHWEQGGSSMSK